MSVDCYHLFARKFIDTTRRGCMVVLSGDWQGEISYYYFYTQSQCDGCNFKIVPCFAFSSARCSTKVKMPMLIQVLSQVWRFLYSLNALPCNTNVPYIRGKKPFTHTIDSLLRCARCHTIRHIMLPFEHNEVVYNSVSRLKNGQRSKFMPQFFKLSIAKYRCHVYFNDGLVPDAYLHLVRKKGS